MSSFFPPSLVPIHLVRRQLPTSRACVWLPKLRLKVQFIFILVGENPMGNSLAIGVARPGKEELLSLPMQKVHCVWMNLLTECCAHF